MYQLQNLIYIVWLLYPRHPVEPKTTVDSQCVRLKYGLHWMEIGMGQLMPPFAPAR
jgi:hypothetical protein